MPSHRWRTLAVATFAQGAFVAAFFSVPVTAPVLIDEYALSVRQLGLVLAAIDIGSALALMGWGALADRIGERVVIAAGLGSSAVALLAAAHAPSFAALTVLLVCTGALGSCVYTATGRLVSAVFDAGERGVAMAIRHSSNLFAGAIAALVLPQLTRPADATTALTAVAVTIALAAATSGLLLGARPRDPEPTAEATPPSRDRRVLGISGGSGLLFLAQACLLSFFVVYLHEEQEVDARLAAAVFAATQISGAAIRLLAGHWSDRAGTRIRPLLLIGAGMTAALFVTAAVAGAPLEVVAVPLLLATVLSMSWASLSYTAVAEVGGARAGMAIAIQQTTLSLGSLTAPILFAILIGSVGWGGAFGAAGAAALAGVVVIRRFRYEPVPRRTSTSVSMLRAATHSGNSSPVHDE